MAEHDPRHDVKVVAVLYDVELGRFHLDARGSTFDWTDGNWSCDCNRYDPSYDYQQTNSGRSHGVCEGCHRFVVVAVHPLLGGYTLQDFNPGYEPDAVAKAMVVWCGGKP